MKTLATILFSLTMLTTACKKKTEGVVETKDPMAKPADPVVVNPATMPGQLVGATNTMTMSVDDLGKQTVTVFGKISEAVKVGSGDCAKILTGLQPLKVELDAIVKAGKEMEKDPAKQKEFDDKYGKQVNELMGPTMTGVASCKDDAAVKAFFAGLE
ncbi:MAG: hypothetical protein H0T79_24515 [Deltaproteobacteria bacterium]|nr:hypothetical protein [Deltaproteobacteria bacterium]